MSGIDTNWGDDEARGASLDAYAGADLHPDFDPTDVGNYEPLPRADTTGWGAR